MKARPLVKFADDLEGTPRDLFKPDLGFYEYRQ
jgi:hypothetical protein